MDTDMLGFWFLGSFVDFVEVLVEVGVDGRCDGCSIVGTVIRHVGTGCKIRGVKNGGASRSL